MPNKSFWRHEYNKHGHCYTERYGFKGVESFFQKVMSIFKDQALDQLIVHTFGEKWLDNVKQVEFNHDNLLQMFKYSRNDLHFYLICKAVDNKQYLHEVRIAFDLGFNSFSHPPDAGEITCDKGKTIIIPFDS
jgi:ribonuclease I